MSDIKFHSEDERMKKNNRTSSRIHTNIRAQTLFICINKNGNNNGKNGIEIGNGLYYTICTQQIQSNVKCSSEWNIFECMQFITAVRANMKVCLDLNFAAV